MLELPPALLQCRISWSPSPVAFSFLLYSYSSSRCLRNTTSYSGFLKSDSLKLKFIPYRAKMVIILPLPECLVGYRILGWKQWSFRILIIPSCLLASDIIKYSELNSFACNMFCFPLWNHLLFLYHDSLKLFMDKPVIAPSLVWIVIQFFNTFLYKCPSRSGSLGWSIIP